MGIWNKGKDYDTEIALLNERQNELSQQTNKNKSEIIAFGTDFSNYKTSIDDRMNEVWEFLKHLNSDLAEFKKWKEEQNRESVAIETAKTVLPDTLTYKEVCQSLKDFTYLTTTTLKYHLYECGIMELKINPIHNTFRISENFNKSESELKKYIHMTDGAITFDKTILDYFTNNPKGLQESIDRYIRKQKQFNKSKEIINAKKAKNYIDEIHHICGLSVNGNYNGEKYGTIYQEYSKVRKNWYNEFKKYETDWLNSHPEYDKNSKHNKEYPLTRLKYIISILNDGDVLLKIACELFVA